MEGQFSCGSKGINQVREGDPDETGQHLRNAALLLQFGSSSFVRAEPRLCAGRAVLASLSPGVLGGCGCRHGTQAAERAGAPASRSELLSRSARWYFCSFSQLYTPRASSEPGSSAAIGQHGIISALTCCFSTLSRSPGRYSETSTSVRKADRSLQSSASFLSTSSPAMQTPCCLETSSMHASSAVFQDAVQI